ALALLISGPISIFSGIFLTFYERSRIAKIIRASLELIVEFPTIVVGIVVFSVFVVGFSIANHTFNIGLNGISGAIALSIVMLPYSTIQISESLRIPRRLYEEVGYSLGLSTWQVMKLIVSASRRGIITGLLIGFAKIIGETAPILLVTTSTANLYLTSFTSPVTGVPVLIYNYAFSGYSNLNEVAWGASFVLIMIVIIIFIIVRSLVK
ncbi:MAG: ABC transporter permease subunit, partial [Sulfolobaceae archaeon]